MEHQPSPSLWTTHHSVTAPMQFRKREVNQEREPRGVTLAKMSCVSTS